MKTKLKVRNFIWLLVVLMVSLGLAHAQDAGFTETFDDPAMPGWDRSPGVTVEDGVMRIEPNNSVGRPGEWGNYTLSVRLRTEGDGAMAISFRSGPEGSYHLLYDAFRVTLQRESQGQVYELAGVEADVSPGDWLDLTLQTLDGDFRVSLFGDVILEYEDADPLGFETLGDLTALIDQVSLVPSETDESQSAEASTEVVESGPVSSGVPAHQSQTWIYTGGPIGGLGYDIRMDPRNPDVMYVTDAWAGAFKSLDGGANWFPINNGITSRVGPSNEGIPVFSLTIDPNNPDTIWAGTQFGGGVFRSDDAGGTWRSMSNGIQERTLTIRGFTVEPGNSNVVYLGGEIPSHEWNGEPLPGLGLDMVKGAVYKTSDGGQNWTRIWYGDNLTRYIWIHPQDHNLLYVSTGIFDREAANSNPNTLEPGGVGILRSRDGGATWDELGVANGIRAEELYFGSLYMNPENPDILIGAAGNDPYLYALGRPIGAIYRTTDGGDSWDRVLDLPNASAMELCESDPNVVYAASLGAFYRSDDGGDSWLQLGGTGDTGQTGSSLWGSPDEIAGFPIDMQCDPREPMRIFVNNYGGGNFVSTDGGQNWSNASKGYTGALMHQVVVSPGNSSLVYASARSGIFASSDGGENWRGMSHGVARAMEAYAIAVDPSDSSYLIATVGDAGPVPKISTDGGHTWHEAEPSFGEMGFFEWGIMKKVFFSPQTQGRVLGIQAENECGEMKPCEGGQGVIISDDGGKSWRLSGLKEGMATDLAFAADGSIYVSVYPGKLYRSTDDGENWELVADNIDAGVSVSDPDPDRPGPAVLALAVDPNDSTKIYAGFSRGGVMISVDGGVSWSASSSGMNPETSVVDLVADLANPGVVYAATPDSGVYVSTDGGATWSAINTGLLTRAAVSLALSADGSVLYVATTGGGVFRLGTLEK